jgi:transcriptional regulator with XRE-family HTH domain
MTQANLAQKAHVTAAYVWKLESGRAAPGIDLVDRLAKALGTSIHELLPVGPQEDVQPLLREQAKSLFDQLLAIADLETLLMLNPLLARLLESPARRRA